MTLAPLALIALSVPWVACFAAEVATPVEPTTQVLEWKDGKSAVFLLAFDDSCQSHIKNAIPELKKRGMVGTFYVNPGKGQFQGLRADWEKAVTGGSVELGNHTFTHVGATSVEQLDVELAKCSEVIQQLYPERKSPRLASFGRPGGVPWEVKPEEAAALLAKHHLVDRPPFHGPPIAFKTIEEMEKLVDSTIAKGEMGHLDFHGVGGDWLVASMEYFNATLDKLESCRDSLWLTDAVSYHKYMTERNSAQVTALASDAKEVRLQLTCSADAELYDLPLTLSTRVPAGWSKCVVSQGEVRTAVGASDGQVRYDALPNGAEIVIRQAD